MSLDDIRPNPPVYLNRISLLSHDEDLSIISTEIKGLTLILIHEPINRLGKSDTSATAAAELTGVRLYKAYISQFSPLQCSQ